MKMRFNSIKIIACLFLSNCLIFSFFQLLPDKRDQEKVEKKFLILVNLKFPFSFWDGQEDQSISLWKNPQKRILKNVLLKKQIESGHKEANNQYWIQVEEHQLKILAAQLKKEVFLALPSDLSSELVKQLTQSNFKKEKHYEIQF